MKKILLFLLCFSSFLFAAESEYSLDYFYNHQDEAQKFSEDCDNSLMQDADLETFTKCLNAYGGILAFENNDLEKTKKEIIPFIEAYKWFLSSKNEAAKTLEYYQENPDLAKQIYRNCFYSFLNSSQLSEQQVLLCERTYKVVKELQEEGDNFQVVEEIK